MGMCPEVKKMIILRASETFSLHTLSYQVEKRIENKLNIKGESHDKRRYHHNRSCNSSLCLYSININQELQMKKRAPHGGVFFAYSKG